MNGLKLIIAEKPSVGKSIAAALSVTEKKDGYIEGNGCIVSWCIGHLIGLADAAAYDERYGKWNMTDLPILPDEWQFSLSKDKEKQFSVLKALMHRADVSEVINACDAGREGELIFRLVYNHADCEKPVKRLWISSMEESAIRTGFEHLADGKDYDTLYQSALCRMEADWMVGINATRLFSTLYGHTLNVGRVQTPTLKMLADRGKAIRDFKKEPFYIVRLDLSGAEAASAHFPGRNEADTLAASCKEDTAVCTSVTREEKQSAPPKLFDLTSLQREANRIFGYTAKQTLDLAQILYEKKLLTYPRTDSRYLTDDMKSTAEKVISLIGEKMTYTDTGARDVTRIINNAGVTDHHAIIPTMELERAPLSTLPDKELDILSLVAARLLCATGTPHIYEAVKANFSCAGEVFTAAGKTIISDGWKAAERAFLSSLPGKQKQEADGENTLPDYAEGQTFERPAARVTEHETKPPAAYTEGTLLSTMENAGSGDMPAEAERKGLGTPATRASVIEKIVKGGFVERKGKSLAITQDGENLIKVLPEALTSPMLTAEWENSLNLIAKGELSPDDFMRGIADMTAALVKENREVPDELKSLFAQEKAVIGVCPRCGAEVIDGKKGYYCAAKDCSFTMWKNDRFFAERRTSFTAEIAATLLKEGYADVKKLYAPKSGKTYAGRIVLADTGGKYVNYRIEIPKK